MMEKIITILAFFVLITACSNGSTGITTPDGVDAALINKTWNYSTYNGEDVSSFSMTLTYDETSSFTITYPTMPCTITGTYTADGSTVITTITSVTGSCGTASVGDTDTSTYTITSNTLTATEGSDVSVYTS